MSYRYKIMIKGDKKGKPRVAWGSSPVEAFSTLFPDVRLVPLRNYADTANVIIELIGGSRKSVHYYMGVREPKKESPLVQAPVGEPDTETLMSLISYEMRREVYKLDKELVRFNVDATAYYVFYHIMFKDSFERCGEDESKCDRRLAIFYMRAGKEPILLNKLPACLFRSDGRGIKGRKTLYDVCGNMISEEYDLDAEVYRGLLVIYTPLCEAIYIVSPENPAKVYSYDMIGAGWDLYYSEGCYFEKKRSGSQLKLTAKSYSRKGLVDKPKTHTVDLDELVSQLHSDRESNC